MPGTLNFEGVPRQAPLPTHRGGRREHLYLEGIRAHDYDVGGCFVVDLRVFFRGCFVVPMDLMFFRLSVSKK